MKAVSRLEQAEASRGQILCLRRRGRHRRRWLLNVRGEIDHWIVVFLYRDRLIINVDRVVLEGDVHAISI